MKYTLVLCVLIAVWLALTIADLRRGELNAVRERIPNYSWAEMSDIFTREQELKDEMKRIQRYHRNQVSLLNRLSSERLSLRNAATTLDAQARDDNPRIHDMLEDRFPSLSRVERMALLLLEHLEADGCKPEVIELLCREMTTWSEADPMLFRQPRRLNPH
jgi:hypothetical protein